MRLLFWRTPPYKRWVAGYPNPDTHPYRLEIKPRAADGMPVPGSQRIEVIVGQTAPDLYYYLRKNKILSHPRLLRATLTGPDGFRRVLYPGDSLPR